MLQLHDPHWSALYAGGEDPAWVPRWLQQLLDNPNDLASFGRWSWMLCSEEITWSAAFAAAPYLVEVTRRAQPAARVQYVCFLGAVAMYRVPPNEEEPVAQCPPELEEEFREAIAAALGMAVTLLPTAEGEPELREILAAIAAFKGFPALARGIVDVQHGQQQEFPQEDVAF